MHGHIRKRGKRRDGSWKWQARYPDPARGGTAEISRTFHSEREARNWLASQRGSQLTGEWVDPRRGDRPFREVVAAWQESWVDLSPKTALRYESIIRVHLLPEFGSRRVSTITPELVQRWVNRLAAEGAKPGTVRNCYACLRNAFATAVRLRMVALNPCTKIKLPRLPREEMLFLSADEVRTLAEAITPHYRVLVYTAAYTGLRAGELHALRRQDVDLLRSVLHVRRALRDVNGHLTVGETKTRSTRTVTLPGFLRAMLNDHLSQSPGGPDDLVFTAPRGGPIRHDLMYARHFKPAVRKALPTSKHGLRFHDLRHTCASLLVATGAHPLLVSRTLGHSSISITMDRYSHLLPSLETALGDALDATFAEAQAPTQNVVALR